ncbi:MAG: NAD(P)-dependent oxidoreductase [Gammaproteobacteria bacterium]|nr:NAD(P)-dependent oxidoreductase [Gammaproteobacteria bacterium]
MRFCVLGAGGFIGGHLAATLSRAGHEVYAPERGVFPEAGRELGHVIYAIGLTGDFRRRPYDTVEAHVSLLARWLRDGRYESFLYLSSARVYGKEGVSAHTREDAPLTVLPGPDSLYDLSKLTGEALCLAHSSPRVRVVRLSNVYGPGMAADTFLGAVLAELRRQRRVVIGEAPESCKDYVAIDDVVPALVHIATRGRERIYNLASGQVFTHAELATALRNLGGDVTFQPGAPIRRLPAIDTARLRQEFPYVPTRLETALPELLAALSPTHHEERP